MKIRSAILFATAVFATLDTVNFATASSGTEFKSFILNLKSGSSSLTVRTVLGSPNAILGPDLWIYWSFGSPNPNRDPEFDTLVVAFADDCVTAMKVTDGRVVRQLLALARTAKIAAVVAPPVKR